MTIQGFMYKGSPTKLRNIMQPVTKLFIFVLFTFIAAAANFPAQAQTQIPTVEKGELTAPNRSLFDDPPLEINGEWEVIWGSL